MNEVDDVPSPPLSFTFVHRYEVRESRIPQDQLEFVGGCEHDHGEKCDELCPCILDGYKEDEKPEPNYRADGRLRLKSNARIINECNNMCSCGETCTNKVVGRGRKIPLEIFRTEKKGWGEWHFYIASLVLSG